MRVAKSIIKYILIFLFVFLGASFFFSVVGGDVLWNYGFCYALSMGEIPYLDFNMIITPFFPFLMSLFFRLFSHNIIVFYIVNSYLVTIMFHFIFKLFDYKGWLIFIFLFFPLPAVLFPSYNLFLIFLVVILLYLERNNGNDYLIGFILGIAILTKQTVGFFLCLPSLYYLCKDYKKVLRRISSCLVLCLIFLIYLILTGSFMNFLDLCLFGMFDFTTGNGRLLSPVFLFSAFLFIFLIYRIIKDKRNIWNYYCLAFFSIVLPLFDINHFLYFLFIFIFLFLDDIKIRKKELYLCSIFFTCIYVVLFFITNVGFNITYPNHYNNFEIRFMHNSNGEFEIRDKINSFIKKNKNKEIVLLSSEAYFYKITNNMKITYFDLLNKGNSGYNGTKKMIDRVKKLPDETLFIISYDEYAKEDKLNRQQINKDIMKYVIDNSEEIERYEGFRIYKMK